MTPVRERIGRVSLRDGARDRELLDAGAAARSLLASLAANWSIDARVVQPPVPIMVPRWLAEEMGQVIREAVANAVRHAGARSITVTLGAGDGDLLLDIINDGASGAGKGKKPETPQSLSERVAQAGGTLDISRGMGVTKVAISLPLAGRVH